MIEARFVPAVRHDTVISQRLSYITNRFGLRQKGLKLFIENPTYYQILQHLSAQQGYAFANSLDYATPVLYTGKAMRLITFNDAQMFGTDITDAVRKAISATLRMKNSSEELPVARKLVDDDYVFFAYLSGDSETHDGLRDILKEAKERVYRNGNSKGTNGSCRSHRIRHKR